MLFKVGDRVRVADTNQVGTVISVDEMVMVDVEADFELLTCDPQLLIYVERYDEAIRLPIYVDYVGTREWSIE